MRHKFKEKKINVGIVLQRNAITDSSNSKYILQYLCEYNKQGANKRLGPTAR
jgi:hypothetical protein